jgi:hypothetical protein
LLLVLEGGVGWRPRLACARELVETLLDTDECSIDRLAVELPSVRDVRLRIVCGEPRGYRGLGITYREPE